MLIVAIPKSASTSLLKTFGVLHGIESVQDFSIKDYKAPEGASILNSIHSDLREITGELADRFSDEETLYKQHIFPSENNLSLLKNVKKVVLLRDPEEIVLAYYRGAHKKVHTLLEGYSLSFTQEEWIEKSRQDGLMNELHFFHDRWLKEEDQNTLIIWYKDLLNKPKEVVNSMESLFGLKPTDGDVVLARERYSRRKGLEYISYLIGVYSKKGVKKLLRIFRRVKKIEY